MADIQQQNPERLRKHTTLRQKRASTFIDMTPMVDLAFLLLTFFILTTSFKNLRTIDMTMPAKTPPTHPNTISDSQTFNLILLKDNKIKWYVGGKDKLNTIADASFSESAPDNIRKILHEKNSIVNNVIVSVCDSIKRGLISDNKSAIESHINIAKQNSKGLMVLIKTDNNAKFNNLVKALDEISLSDIGRYSIMDLTEKEKEYLKKND